MLSFRSTFPLKSLGTPTFKKTSMYNTHINFVYAIHIDIDIYNFFYAQLKWTADNYFLFVIFFVIFLIAGILVFLLNLQKMSLITQGIY